MQKAIFVSAIVLSFYTVSAAKADFCIVRNERVIVRSYDADEGVLKRTNPRLYFKRNADIEVDRTNYRRGRRGKYFKVLDGHIEGAYIPEIGLKPNSCGLYDIR